MNVGDEKGTGRSLGLFSFVKGRIDSFFFSLVYRLYFGLCGV